MKKRFYSHLIDIESINLSLYLLDLNERQKQELMLIVESNIHHVVIDTVMSELSEEDKKKFLSHLAAEKHEEIWSLLEGKIKNIEEKIKQAVQVLKQELHKDIMEVKKTPHRH
jgi:hypothetical protein